MNKPELPPHYTVTDLRKAEGVRALDYADGGRPFQVHRAGELIDEIVQLPGGSYFAEHNDAVYACWAHWTKYADPAWVEYIALHTDTEDTHTRTGADVQAIAAWVREQENNDAVLFEQEVDCGGFNTGVSMVDLDLLAGALCEHFVNEGDEPTREPFDGFDEAEPAQIAAAQTVVDAFKETFAAAKLAELTTDDVIMSANMQQFAEQAIRDNAGKSSKLVRAIFDSKTQRGQCMSIMLAQLLIRLYRAPYGSLNEAGLDFANVLVPVLEVAVAVSFPKLKFGGKARGKAK